MTVQHVHLRKCKVRKYVLGNIWWIVIIKNPCLAICRALICVMVIVREI